MNKPRTTIAKIPDTFRNVNSAQKKQMQQVIKVIADDRTSSLTTLLNQKQPKIPAIIPSKGPPPAVLRNPRTIEMTVQLWPVPSAAFTNPMKSK